MLRPHLKEKFLHVCSAVTVPLGVSVVTALNTLKTSRFPFFSSLSLLSVILLSGSHAHLGLSTSRPHRLVVRVVGCPRPQTLIGIKVHGVHFLPAYLLQGYGCLKKTTAANNLKRNSQNKVTLTR